VQEMGYENYRFVQVGSLKALGNRLYLLDEEIPIDIDYPNSPWIEFAP